VFFLIFFFPILTMKKPGWSKVLLMVSLVNSMTHPWVVFFFVKGPWTYLEGILLAESFAIGSETLLYRYCLGLSLREAITGSLVANLISWQLGPVLTGLIFLLDYL
jgi:hypothetical protein